MAVEDDDDLDQFLDPDEFGENFTWTGGTLTGIFNNESYSVESGEVMVDVQNPNLLVKTSDIAAMVQGDTLTRAKTSQAFKSVAFHPDGTGLTIIELRG